MDPLERSLKSFVAAVVFPQIQGLIDISGYPGTYHVDRAGLKLRDLLASACLPKCWD